MAMAVLRAPDWLSGILVSVAAMGSGICLPSRFRWHTNTTSPQFRANQFTRGTSQLVRRFMRFDLVAQTLQAAEKLKTLSFRGTLRAEESLFSCVSNTERFLTSFGMTGKGTFSASCGDATAKHIYEMACTVRVLLGARRN